MSEVSSLSELAKFVGQSHLLSADAAANRRAVNDIVGHLSERPARQRVSDLLAVVLSLSARTRRAALPKIDIELDVFAPSGERAVRLSLPR